MRIVASEFESISSEVDSYVFLNCIVANVKTEPFFLRHEYYDDEKDLKQSLYLFGRRSDEQGAQVFIESYRDYTNNTKYQHDFLFYENQKKKNSKLKGANDQGALNLLPEISGIASCDLLITKDGKYRRRVLYDIKGKRDAILLLYSIDSDRFNENHLFNFVKNNVKIDMRQNVA